MMQENIIESVECAQAQKNRIKQQVPASVDADTMSASELNEKLEFGYIDMIEGRIQDASQAFKRFREKSKR